MRKSLVNRGFARLVRRTGGRAAIARLLDDESEEKGYHGDTENAEKTIIMILSDLRASVVNCLVCFQFELDRYSEKHRERYPQS